MTTDLSQVKMPFPWKLYHMLEEAEKPEKGFSNVVSWLPDGQAFKIFDETTFVNNVMSTYFNQTKIKSFTRQLYIYGFLKIGSGPNEGAFYHPDFIRQNKELCYSLKRNQAGDRRRSKATRRGSASSYNSASSYESYDSGTPVPNMVGSTRAQRRSSLSDYASGRPANVILQREGRMPRRSSIGSSIPVQHTSSSGASLSDFFEQAVSLLPNDGAFADLPCADALEPTPLPNNIAFVNEHNNTYTARNLGYPVAEQQSSTPSLPNEVLSALKTMMEPTPLPSDYGNNNDLQYQQQQHQQQEQQQPQHPNQIEYFNGGISN